MNQKQSKINTGQMKISGKKTEPKSEKNEMNREDLRRLRRLDLLELLLVEREENDRLREKIQEQKKTIQELDRKLEDRNFHISKVGSMAEAALALNHIFEDADAAAQQFLENLRENAEEDDPLKKRTKKRNNSLYQARETNGAGEN